MANKFKAVLEKLRQEPIEAKDESTAAGAGGAAATSANEPKKTFWDHFASAVKGGGNVKKKVAELQKQLDNVGVGDDALNTDAERLEDILQLKHLKQLRDLFMRHRPPPPPPPSKKDNEGRQNKKETRQPGLLTPEELKEFVISVMNGKQYADQIETLFSKLDTSCDGFVDWSEFCTYLLLYLKENDLLANKRERVFTAPPRLKHLTLNRQEPSSRVLFTENPTKLVCASKNGSLSVWTPSGLFENSVLCYSDEGANYRPGKTRRFHMWITDAVYMHNCHTISVCSTGRDIHFFDYGSGLLKEVSLLYGFTDVILCMDYHYDKQEPNDASYLILGDEMGNIFFITLHRPTQQFFDLPNSVEDIQKVWLPEIELHSRFIKVESIPNVHSDGILHLRYMPDNHCTISCSQSSRESVLIYDLARRQAIYTFSLRRGCQCFHLHRGLNLLATGSADHLIRLWNPYVTNRPTAIIEGHHAPVLAVHILQNFGSLVSFSRDCVIKVWDIKDQRCLQTVQMKVPGFHSQKLPEFQPMPLHISEVNNLCIVIASDYMLIYKLGKPPDPPSQIAKSHQAPLCGVIFNEQYKQIVTGCDRGVVMTWDLETGNKALQLASCHDGEEITSLNFDESQRKLISASRNGSVRVWNMQNGQCLHNLIAASDLEITGLYWSDERNIIYTVGWSRNIVKYDISKSQTYNIMPQFGWRSGVVHKEDILCCDVCPPNFMVTGSYDGELILWSLDTEIILQRLRMGRQEPVWRTVSRIQAHKTSVSSASTRANNSRPNSRHRGSYKTPTKGMPIPVDCIKFLKHRLLSLKSSGAVLISSDAGTINWWRIFGSPLHVGSFYAASQPDEAILSMSTSHTDSLLVVGDSAGTIILWDITHYCMRDSQQSQWKVKPPLIRSWKAHDGAIVGVQLIQHEIGRFLVTASTDATAKLFTILGEAVGVFGQRIPWQLKYRKTWSEYKDAYYLDEEDIPRQQSGVASRNSIAEPSTQFAIVSNLNSKNPDHSLLTNAFITRFSKENTMMSRTLSELDTVVEQDPSTVEDLSSQNILLPPMESMRRSKTILGVKAERDMQRIREARHSRRNHFGDVNVNKTLRFGTLCSPFSALSTMNLQSHKISPNLPMPGTRRKSHDVNDIADVTPEHLIEVGPFLHNFSAFQQCLTVGPGKAAVNVTTVNAAAAAGGGGGAGRGGNKRIINNNNNNNPAVAVDTMKLPKILVEMGERIDE